jgi:ABC-2 type transport system permease protein
MRTETTPYVSGPRFWSVVLAYAATDAKVLWRMKTPLIFMFVVPALLSILLGPAVSGAANETPGRSVIGFAVLFSFMTINYVGLALFREFVANTWLRQAIFRPARLAFLLGKILPVACVGFVQLSVFWGAASAVYHLPLHGSVFQLVFIAVGLVMCGSLAGVVLHNLCSTTSTFQSVTYLLLIGMGGIGGTIVTPDKLPAFSRWLGPLTPHYWAMRALMDATVGSGDWTETLRALAVLTSMCIVLAAVAHATFDFRAEKSVLA